MILKEDIKKAADTKIKEIGGYLVDIKVNTTNVIKIYFDRVDGVLVEHCLSVSKYIEEKFPGDENAVNREHHFNKLTKKYKSFDTNTGRFSCSLINLQFTNFQGYKGTHSINFSLYKNHCAIAITGKNAVGKSTIILAFEFVIWGFSPREGLGFINNQSKNTEVILIFLLHVL